MSSSSPTKTRSAASYSRRRAGNACLICRARKTKCDNQRPVCGFCAATGGECQYTDTDASQFDRASLAILHRLSELESTLVSHIDGSFRAQQLSNVTEGGDLYVQTTGRHDHVSTSFPGDESLNHTIQGNPLTHNKNGAADLHEDRPPSSKALLQTSRMVLEYVLKWPVFSQTAPHLQEDLQTPILEIWANSDLSQQSGNKIVGMMNLEGDWIKHLIENFLTHNHIKNPILDVDLLRSYARDFAETGPQWDGKSCLLLLICAVSCVSAPLDRELAPGPSKDHAKLEMAEAYFQASQRRIGTLYHQTSLIVAQCSFLTGVYLMATMQILAAWKCFVQAGTQCLAWLISQGRMKETGKLVQRNPDATINYAEESLYWSCLKSEIELRVELELPGSGINEIEYPHVFPSPPTYMNSEQDRQNFHESPDLHWSSPKAQVNSSDRQNLELGWFFYLAEIALKRMAHNVISWLHNFDSSAISRSDSDRYLAAGAIEFETQVQDWYKTLPSLMRFPNGRNQPSGDILRYILRGHMVDIREFARFPSIYNVLSAPSVLVISEYSSTSIRLVRELLENAVVRIKTNHEGWYHRHQGTWLMARTAARSALHLLGMALKCQQAAATMNLDRQELEREALPVDWKEAVDMVIELLDYWGDESVDLERLARIFRELLRCYEAVMDAGRSG